MTSTSLFYFYSTLTQSLAAVVGIAATIVVFRYQNLLNKIDTKREHIVRALKLNAVGELNFNKAINFGTDEGIKYRDLTSHKDRCVMIKRLVFDDEGRLKESVLNDIKKYANNNTDTINAESSELQGWYLEFMDLEKFIKALIDLKNGAILNSSIGLIMIISGSLLDFSSEEICAPNNLNRCTNSNLYCWSFLPSAVVAIYFFFTVRAFSRGLVDQ